MKTIGIIISTCGLTLCGFFQNKSNEWTSFGFKQDQTILIGNEDTLYLTHYLDTVFDSTRNRYIPFSIDYFGDVNPKGIIVFSHGYSNNRPDAYLSYSYLIEKLIDSGYFVLSVQHEHIGDPSFPNKGDLQELRKPFWVNGALNIEQVLAHTFFKRPLLKDYPLILIGHSNGGDQSAYYAMQHPGEVYALITLDNWRHSLCDVEVRKGFTIRASDSKTDEIVFKNWQARKTQDFQIKSVNVKHADMNDKGTEVEKREVSNAILTFLQQ